MSNNGNLLQSAQGKAQEKPRRNDMSHEYEDKIVSLLLHDGKVIDGKLIEATKY